MKRLIAIGCLVLASFALGSQNADAQNPIPNWIVRPQYVAPTYYYVPRARGYVPTYYGYNPYYNPYRNVYRYRPQTITIQTTPAPGTRLQTNHPSHYFGDPHASQFTR